MPFEINEEVFKRQTTVNMRMPQEIVADNATGTNSGGLPVRQIPHREYPKSVYKYPKKPFMQIEHKNDKFEVVGIEIVPTTHKVKTVHDETELKQALAKGWHKEPYLPPTPPKPDVDIYDDDDEDIPSLPPAPRRSTRGSEQNPL